MIKDMKLSKEVDLTPEEIFIEEYKNINKLGCDLYCRKRTEEVNLFKEFKEQFELYNKTVSDLYIKHIDSIEPNLVDKTNFIQKLTISMTIIETLYYIKGLYKKADIFNSIKALDYTKDDGEWLDNVSNYLIPWLSNISKLKE